MMDYPDAYCAVVECRADNRVILLGNPDLLFADGFTCRKIKDHTKRLQHPACSQHPLSKVDDSWRQITWQEALHRMLEWS